MKPLLQLEGARDREASAYVRSYIRYGGLIVETRFWSWESVFGAVISWIDAMQGMLRALSEKSEREKLVDECEALEEQLGCLAMHAWVQWPTDSTDNPRLFGAPNLRIKRAALLQLKKELDAL